MEGCSGIHTLAMPAAAFDLRRSASRAATGSGVGTSGGTSMRSEPEHRSSAGAAPAGAAPNPENLYATHFAFVWRNLRRMGVAEELLEDAAQDVFLTIHQRWESYDPERAAIETWVFGILLRVASYHRRTLRRRLARLVPWSILDQGRPLASDGDGPQELVAKRQAAHLLDRLLQRVSHDKRAVLVLVDVEQFSVPQAAEALGINLNTAYWRLRQGRKAFERMVERLQAREERLSKEGHVDGKA